MSHQKERKENNCLNCGTTVLGRYCHVCGQENIETNQSFWGLVKHFIYDIFHFDGKFFDTLKYLFFKPGSVAKEYVQGKRVKYLDPIRMYLFTSAFFFFLFFSFSSIKPETKIGEENYLSKAQRFQVLIDKLNKAKLNPSDTLLQKQVNLLLDTTQRFYLRPSAFNDSSKIFNGNGKVYYVRSPDFNVEEIQSQMPKNWISNWASHTVTTFERKYDGDINKGFAEMINGFLHRLPYMLFISLPFFAGILTLLYVKRKSFFYADHAVFTLYYYIFSFILLLVAFLLGKLADNTGWSIFNYGVNVCLIIWPVYLFISMKRFYQDSIGKTFSKFLLLNLLGLFTLFLLFLLFGFYSLSQI